jgi:hypothetical protein
VTVRPVESIVAARRKMAEAAGIAGLHHLDYTPTIQRAVREAIKCATTVRVTDAHVQAARPGTTPRSVVWTRTRGRLVRAFRAAGFEVEL